MFWFKDGKEKCVSICHIYLILIHTNSQLYVVAGLCVSVCWCGRSSLEGIQQTVDAADELLPLAGQSLLALDVSLLLDLACHQPLRLLAGATHQLLHLAVQLLHLPNLTAQRGESASQHIQRSS